MKVIVPMAGTGNRFVQKGYEDPKPLIRINGKRIIEYIIDAFDKKKDEFIFVCNEDHLKTTKMEEILSSHARHYTREYFVNMIYSSWLSIMKSNMLKEQYRLANGINYDFVIRARFDSQINVPIDCSKFDPNFLYTDSRPSLPPRMIEDWFAFGSNLIMNAYSSGFNFIEKFVEESNKFDKIFCGETIVYEMVRMANLNHIRVGGLIHSPVRQNMV